MSTTIYLKFPDKATFEATLPANFVRYGETGAPLPSGVQAISIIGTLYTGGTYDAQGNTLVAPTLVPGYHVNALGSIPASWAPFVITPSTPSRVFG